MKDWVIAGIVAIAIVIGIGYYQTEQKNDFNTAMAEIESSPTANISPTGELAEIFRLNSSYTNIQRSNTVEDIRGRIVQWTLPVYEIRKNDGNVYNVQTSEGGAFLGGSRRVGTFVEIHARNTTEASYIESLRTGDMLTFKGRITGTFLRNIKIEPAVVIMR